MDVALGADRHLDIGLQVVEAHPLFPYFLEKRLAIPTLLLSFTSKCCFFVIRECSSTLYVGLARTAPPTNTKFRLTFLLTRLQEVLYEDLAV